jgi:hypothetical protein
MEFTQRIIYSASILRGKPYCVSNKQYEREAANRINLYRQFYSTAYVVFKVNKVAEVVKCYAQHDRNMFIFHRRKPQAFWHCFRNKLPAKPAVWYACLIRQFGWE